MSGPEVTKTTDALRHTEIGILLYPGCAMASVYGLTDAFQVGNDYARQHGGADRIRTSHWRMGENGGTRAFDSDPAVEGQPNTSSCPAGSPNR